MLGSELDHLTYKLHTLKLAVTNWIKDKSALMVSESRRLDEDINSLLSNSSSGILSHDEQTSLSQLRREKNKILEHYLLTWQLKSRTKWALEGDSNTKYFHALASGRRNQNAIWALEDEDGRCVEEEVGLKELGLRHLSHIFRDDKQTCILDQLKVVMFYPSMLSSEEASCFIENVLMSEIEDALRSFKKDKSPSPDGWPVEFFLLFFDLLGRNLLKAVECSRMSGRITPSLNSLP